METAHNTHTHTQNNKHNIPWLHWTIWGIICGRWSTILISGLSPYRCICVVVEVFTAVKETVDLLTFFKIWQKQTESWEQTTARRAVIIKAHLPAQIYFKLLGNTSLPALLAFSFLSLNFLRNVEPSSSPWWNICVTHRRKQVESCGWDMNQCFNMDITGYQFHICVHKD